MVVGYNEAHFLEACLSSISFCDEIVYTDLGSTDDSIAIAEKYSATIFHREKVPSCEFIQAEMVHKLKNDWVIFIDPDERVDVKLKEDIEFEFKGFQLNELLGAVSVPWVFYFKKHKLKGTVWGGSNEKVLLVNRNRFHFKPIVHFGRELVEGFSALSIPYKKVNCLHHYWMNSYKVFIAKHRRYLKNEPQDRYDLGHRVGRKKLITGFFDAFSESFFTKNGYKDGLIGLYLCAFWGWYEYSIVFKMYKIQKKAKRFV